MELTTVRRSDGTAVGLCGNLFIIYYERTPDMKTAAVVDSAATVALCGLQNVSALIVIDPEARTPEPAVRSAIQKTIQRYESQTLAIAYAITGFGFSNAATRAVISGLLLLVRPPCPTKVHASIRSATNWLRDRVPSTGPIIDNARRVETIERFCTRTAAPPWADIRTA